MIEIRNHYFKTLHDEGLELMSGLPLPDPANGPYHFINCEMHPRLWEAMTQLYNDCKFTNTYIGNYVGCNPE